MLHLPFLPAGAPISLGDSDHPVRFIDAFVDRLDLAAAGFGRVAPKVTGPPGICARGFAKALHLRLSKPSAIDRPALKLA